ncbi:AaceriAGL286Cp [[Ashbya] aceris (nom. inval.)]|nr:AaceriAGL286Cp [[Ashbya] aceris (nom. inval.)]
MTLRGTKAKQQRVSPHIGHTFSFGNLVGDPFAVSTLSIGTIAWLITLAGGIAAKLAAPFTWWGIVFQFLMMVCLVAIYLWDLVDYYRGFLAAGMGVAFVYSTNSCSRLVYDTDPQAACGAGLVMLSIVNVIWLFYFGADNAAPANRWIDSFSIRGIRPSLVESSLALARSQRAAVSPQPATMTFYGGLEGHSQKYVSSTALNGFENTDPHTSSGFALGPDGNTQRNLDTHGTSTYVTDTTNGNTETTMGDTLGLYSDVGDELVNFPYTAKALYAYEADASDAYEISFQQGEILRVGDIEGRWWKAKKANGETGIIPSNYVELVDDPTAL